MLEFYKQLDLITNSVYLQIQYSFESLNTSHSAAKPCNFKYLKILNIFAFCFRAES